MDLDYIAKTFLETLKGVPTTLIIMIVAMVLSFLPALFLALGQIYKVKGVRTCLLYTSPSPRDRQKSRMPSSA